LDINLVSIAVVLCVGISIFKYWAFAEMKWIKNAYRLSLINGVVLIWVNWSVSARGRVPTLNLSGIEWGDDTQALNLFSVLAFWMILASIRGLQRLRQEERTKRHSERQM
jgi:hypothetical protein